MNRTPSQLLHGKTPFEKLYGHAPSFNHLRVFGCLAYAHNGVHQGDKFAPRSRKCAFLGYHVGKKGWLLYDLDKKIVFTSRDVGFCEDKFPFATPSVVPQPHTPEPPPEQGEASFDDSDSDISTGPEDQNITEIPATDIDHQVTLDDPSPVNPL